MVQITKHHMEKFYKQLTFGNSSQRKEFIGEIKMKIKIYNTYHKTTEIVEGETLEEVIKENESSVSITAEWLAENEVEQAWKDYYKTYDEAFNATYDEIFEQLKSEFEYKVVNDEWLELLKEYHLNEYGHYDFLEEHIETIEGITSDQEYDLSDEQEEKLALEIVEYMKWAAGK